NVIIERKKITILYSFIDDSKEYSQVFEINNAWVQPAIESSNNNSNTSTTTENSNKPVEEPNNPSNENSADGEIDGEEILIQDGSTLEALKAEVDFAKSKNWNTIRLYIGEEETYFINGNSKSPKRIGLIKPGIELEKLTVKSAGNKKYITATYTDNSVTLNYTYNNVEYSQGFGWGEIDESSEETVVVDENNSDSHNNGGDTSEAFDASNLFIVASEDNLKETIAKAKKYPNIRGFLQPETGKFLYSKKEIFILKPGADLSKLELESSSNGSSQYIQFNFKNGNKYDLEGEYRYDGKLYKQRIYLGEGPSTNTNTENQPGGDSGTSNTTGGTSTSNNLDNSGTSSDNSGTPVDLSISNSTHYEANSYYSSLQGKRGKELLESLYALQKSKTSRIGSYDSLYNIYTTAFIDKYSENDGTIWDIYSENPNGSDPYSYTSEKRIGRGGSGKSGKNEGTGFNREHVIPQSWFNKVSPTVSDAHFIWPTDAKVNQKRGNLPHFSVSNPSWTSQNGTKVGDGYSEPIDFFKGDVARAYFYFQATHRNGMVTDNGRKVFTGVFPYFTDRFLNEYLDWSNNDPVDLSEVDRNNAIDNYYGGLRNPFIDYPNLPNLIWGNGSETFNDQGILVRN
ncbi:endonuclease, partial [Mycoplasmopsis pullorum]